MTNALVISRLGDHNRRARIAGTIPKSLAWSFLDASDGHQPEGIGSEYTKLLPKLFWGKKNIKPGAFGCFVSHYRAWEACVKSGTATIILEDDVVFSPHTDLIVSHCKTTAFDVALLNRRAVNWHQLYTAYQRLGIVVPHSLRVFAALQWSHWYRDWHKRADLPMYAIGEVIQAIVSANIVPPNPGAPGGDGYFLTPHGARKLIEFANHYGAMVGVDWFIVGCGIFGMPVGNRWKTPSQVASYFSRGDLLRVGVANRWIADAADREVGGSTINHSVSVDIEEYRACMAKF